MAIGRIATIAAADSPAAAPASHRLHGARKEVPPRHDDTGGRQAPARAWHSPSVSTPTMIGRLLNIDEDADQRQHEVGDPELERRP